MECREALELLNDEIDGRLAPKDAARLAEHVAACSACAQVKGELASLRAAFRAVPKDAAPADFRAGVMASLPRGSVRSLPRTLGWIVAVAAVFVVAVTLIPNGSKVAERNVAGVPAEHALEGRAADSAGPPPPEAATPVAPPRPGYVAVRDNEGRDKSAATAEAETKAIDEDSEKAAGTKKDAEGLVPLKEEAARTEGDDSATTRSRAAAPAATVRYLVFRDAASAAKFTESLAALEAGAKKYKAPVPAPAPAKPSSGPAPAPQPSDSPPPATGGGGGGGASEGGFAAPAPAPKQAPRPAEEERRADLMKEAAFQSRRVVSRTPLPAGVVDADLAARVAAAGGTIVPAADAAKFAELLDASAPPPAGATAQSAPTAKADKDTAKQERKDQSQTSADGKLEAERARVVLVIVVLEPPPAGGGK